MDLEECEAFLSRLNQQRNDAEGCDVKLVSLRDGKEFMAHWAVLTAASPHFKRVFHSDFKKAIDGKIELDMDSDIIEILLKYMYTYAIQIDESIVFRLFPEVSYLRLYRLKKRCAMFLLAIVTPSNCIEMWSFACLYTCEKMKDLAWKKMCLNFDSLIDTPEFLGLDKKDLHTFLGDESLRCRESNVFSGVCNWVRADPENRKRHMKELFSLVRLYCLEKDYLVDTVGKEPLVIEDKECFQIYNHCLEGFVVKEPRPYRDRGMNRPWKASGEWTYGRKPRWNIGSCSAVVLDNKIYCANYLDRMVVLSQGKLRLAAPLHAHVGKICVVADRMYVIGHVSGNRNVYKFEKGSETWTLVHSAQGKSGEIVDVTSFNDRICVADKSTKTIETFDPTNAGSGFVRLCAFPPDLTSDFPLCVVDGRLMTVGGWTGSDRRDRKLVWNPQTDSWISKTLTAECTNQVYVWDPQTDSWNAKTPLGEARDSISATVCDGRLVIAGGFVEWQIRQDVQVLVDGEWKQLPSLKHARSKCGLAVLDNVLYAIGGNNVGTSVEMLRLEEE